MVINLGSLVQLCCGEGGTLQLISLACVGSACSVWATLDMPGLTACVLSWSTLLRLQVALLGTKAGPGLRALPRSKLLKFKFLGTPQRPDLVGLMFCALPRSEQLGQLGAWRAHSPQVQCILSPPQSQPIGFLGASWRTYLRCAMFLFWGVDLWLRPSWQMSTIQDPRKICSLVGDVISGAKFALSLPNLVARRSPCLQRRMGQSAAG